MDVMSSQDHQPSTNLFPCPSRKNTHKQEYTVYIDSIVTIDNNILNGAELGRVAMLTTVDYFNISSSSSSSSSFIIK